MARLAAYAPGWPAARVWPEGTALPEEAGPWRSEALLHTCAVGQEPALIFDVSDTWETKLAALACYRSQFRREAGRRPTMINDPEWQRKIERRGAHWGFRAGASRGEALRGRAAPVLRDLPAEVWA
jgi:LmbE family N-acetylglucosaminyl deacetylase